MIDPSEKTPNPESDPTEKLPTSQEVAKIQPPATQPLAQTHPEAGDPNHTVPLPNTEPLTKIPGEVTDPNATVDFPVSDPFATRPLEGAGRQKSSIFRPPAGYTIERELGRGGMGVVYLAWDVALRRPCALKMILSGAHSNPVEVERFRTEAQAIARLQHQGIVQVFEIGEQDGKPFMALEFCPGGSLDAKLAKNPLDAKQAATLVKALAEAVQAAHEAQILHRDLKPGNVLLTEKGEPKVTDFGLAKKLDEEGATRTGSVMGTPAYMPPEQAEGKKDIGPTADIYALGAILYECLASRPPFRAATPWDTVRQLLKEDALPLRQLNGQAPVDLETICGKCLQKDPNKRYASAQELADELGRYLRGEPIRARPISSAERLWKWIRRHPTPTALMAVTLAAGAGGLWYNGRLQGAQAEVKKRSDLARSLADAVGPLVEEWLEVEPGQDSRQQEMLEKTLSIYVALKGEKGEHPSLRQATAKAYNRCGQIAHRLKDSRHAESDYDDAIAIQETLCRQYPDRTDYQRDLANSLNDRGELLRETQRAREALPWYDRAQKIQLLLLASSTDPVNRKDLARTEYNQALALRGLGDTREALATLDRAATRLDLHPLPENPIYRQELARIHLNRSAVLLETNQTDKALQACQLAIDIQRSITAHFSKPDYRYELAVSLCNQSNILRAMGDPTNLVPKILHEAQDILTHLTHQFPTRLNYLRQLARSYSSLGAILYNSSPGEAIKAWATSANLFESLIQQKPDQSDYYFGASQAFGNLGMMLLWKQEPPDSEDALEQLERAALYFDDPQNLSIEDPSSGPTRALIFGNLAEARLRLKDPRGATAATERFLSPGTPSDQERYGAARTYARCLALTDNAMLLSKYSQRAVELLLFIDPKRYHPKDDPIFKKSLADDDAFRILRNRPEFASVKDLWGKDG